MNAALELLRSETRALHEALELTATMRAATEHPGDAGAYADYLTALAIGVRPLVARLHHAPSSEQARFLPDLEAWSHIDLELAALGREVPSVQGFAAPEALSDAAAWGRLYVVRGAEAGVAVLARQRAKASTGPALPSTFAAALAVHRGEWPALCAAMGALATLRADAAAAAAREDFRFVLNAIETWENTMAQAKAA